MAIIVDVSYWAWWKAYAIYMAGKEGQLGWWSEIDNLMSPETILAFDGAGSIRKDHLPWYKANRKNPSDLSRDLKSIATTLMDQLRYRHADHVYEQHGLEADDIVALHCSPGDWLWSNDKDYLQLTDITLTTFKGEMWGCERFKSGHNVQRGNSSLAYQLMYGDTADNIPRRFYGDKQIAADVFQSSNPLLAAVEILDPQQVRASLAALMLPTPLINPTVDIIEQALTRYEVT